MKLNKTKKMLIFFLFFMFLSKENSNLIYAENTYQVPITGKLSKQDNEDSELIDIEISGQPTASEENQSFELSNQPLLNKLDKPIKNSFKSTPIVIKNNSPFSITVYALNFDKQRSNSKYSIIPWDQLPDSISTGEKQIALGVETQSEQHKYDPNDKCWRDQYGTKPQAIIFDNLEPENQKNFNIIGIFSPKFAGKKIAVKLSLRIEPNASNSNNKINNDDVTITNENIET